MLYRCIEKSPPFAEHKTKHIHTNNKHNILRRNSYNMSMFEFKKPKVEGSLTQTTSESSSDSTKYWHILVVDDEPAIHEITHLVLGSEQVFERPIKLHSAYNAAQAKDLLNSDIEFAIAFIDVVMEEDDAGLKLVSWIREDLGNHTVRIVLRTGQSGLAPEEYVIRQYDINDYKTKTEFTALKMLTSVISSIRSFRDIKTILRSLEDFKHLIKSANSVLQLRDLNTFASAILTNMLSLLNLESSALYIVRQEKDFLDNTQENFLASAGKFNAEIQCLNHIPDSINAKIENVFSNKKSVYNPQYFAVFFATSSNTSSVLYVEYEGKGEHFNTGLAELYATNVTLIYENLVRKQQLDQSQRELMYIVGEAVEARSKETGSHVKRVAILSARLSHFLGLSEDFVQAIRTAAPLHDIGKIAIPDNILQKPGKLNQEEWLTMKNHAVIGANMLRSSQLAVAQLGANIAHYHHENWDGSGYPEGLKGEAIPIEARIVALVDVFDALGAKRCYKEVWPFADIEQYIKENVGIKFDPYIVEVFFQHIDQMTEVRSMYPD